MHTKKIKAVISCTVDEKYCWYIPIVIWAWNKFGVGVILFLPESSKSNSKIQFCLSCLNDEYGINKVCYFDMPNHKEATASQCVRLYASALDLSADETLVISDIDMLVLNTSYFLPVADGIIDIYGADLVPPNQYPICYLSGKVSTWRKLIGEGTVQQHLDKELGHIDSLSMRSDYWSKDQELIFNMLQSNDEVDYRLHNRATPGTQFASLRIDRDDSYWIDRYSQDVIDAHLWRPGYQEDNFNKIMQLLSMAFPHEDFNWLVEYRNSFVNLLNENV